MFRIQDLPSAMVDTQPGIAVKYIPRLNGIPVQPGYAHFLLVSKGILQKHLFIFNENRTML